MICEMCKHDMTDEDTYCIIDVDDVDEEGNGVGPRLLVCEACYEKAASML